MGMTEVTELVELSADAAGLSRQDRLAQLRRQIASIPSRGDTSFSGPSVSVAGVSVAGVSETSAAASESVADRDRPVVDRAHKAGVLPVPEGIGALLPQGGLVRGTVVSVDGAASLLLGLVASVTASGGHVAVIGQPRLGLLAAYEMGAQLERLALVPAPGPDPVEIAAVLLDGMDLVILGLAGASVSPSRARAVVARARSKGSTLVVTEGHWDGAEVRLDARVHGYGGFGQGRELGRGRLNSLSLAVRARGRSFQPRTTRLDICSAAGRVEWVPSRPVEGVMSKVVSEQVVSSQVVSL